MKTKTITSTRTINYELNYADTEKRGLKVFQLKKKDSANPGLKPTTGFAFLKDLKDPANIKTASKWALVKQEVLDEVNLYGWGGKNNDYGWCKDIYVNPWQAMKKNKGILVREEDDHHQFYNVNDEPLPVAIYFYYITANISNAAYHLDVVAKVLQERDDIRFEPEGGSDIIQSIPYYNAEPHRNRTIQFYWQPTFDDYQLLYQACRAKNGENHHWSLGKHEAIFNLDLLGLRAAGAAKYDNFYEEDRSEERYEY